MAFALNATQWSVATVTEVHALQMFLDAALLHALVRAGLWGRRPFREGAFLAACYLAGLCLPNHLTSALLLPGCALGLWRRRRDATRRLLALGVGRITSDKVGYTKLLRSTGSRHSTECSTPPPGPKDGFVSFAAQAATDSATTINTSNFISYNFV